MNFNLTKVKVQKAIDAFIAVELCLAGASLFFYSKNMSLCAFFTLAVFAINAIAANIYFVISINRIYHEYIQKENQKTHP